ncbi:segregation and condensation protein A [Jatrophihabitans sp. YIM 134969]
MPPETALAPAAGPETAVAGGRASHPFSVKLTNFEGPFDLLLTLIGNRKLDVTEVALSQVTDEFLAYLHPPVADGDEPAEALDLGRVTEFLVVAATLLDLKAARLLPAADVEDEDDLALLEARDLLFARVLQYRAYKMAAAHLAELERSAGRRHSRSAELEERFVGILPPVEIGVSPERFAALAVRAMTPRPVPEVGVGHIHAARVSVREHMASMREHLAVFGSASFRDLTTACESTLEVVARFLGLLELYREGVVLFDQVTALGDLQVHWVPEDERPTGPTGAEPVEDVAAAPTPDVAEPTDIDIDEEYG